MAVANVTSKPDRAWEGDFQNDTTGTVTDVFTLQAGEALYWQIGSGLTGTYQLQTAPHGSGTFTPVLFGTSADIANGGVSGFFKAEAGCLFRVALTVFASGGPARVQVRKN